MANLAWIDNVERTYAEFLGTLASSPLSGWQGHIESSVLTSATGKGPDRHMADARSAIEQGYAAFLGRAGAPVVGYVVARPGSRWTLFENDTVTATFTANGLSEANAQLPGHALVDVFDNSAPNIKAAWESASRYVTQIGVTGTVYMIVSLTPTDPPDSNAGVSLPEGNTGGSES